MLLMTFFIWFSLLSSCVKKLSFGRILGSIDRGDREPNAVHIPSLGLRDQSVDLSQGSGVSRPQPPTENECRINAVTGGAKYKERSGHVYLPGVIRRTDGAFVPGVLLSSLRRVSAPANPGVRRANIAKASSPFASARGKHEASNRGLARIHEP